MLVVAAVVLERARSGTATLAGKDEPSVVGTAVVAAGVVVAVAAAAEAFAVLWQLVLPARSACASVLRPLWPNPGSISVGREQLDMKPEDSPHLISWIC